MARIFGFSLAMPQKETPIIWMPLKPTRCDKRTGILRPRAPTVARLKANGNAR
jgi:hypothetical protein